MRQITVDKLTSLEKGEIVEVLGWEGNDFSYRKRDGSIVILKSVTITNIADKIAVELDLGSDLNFKTITREKK